MDRKDDRDTAIGAKPTTIDEYIAPFPEDVRQVLREIRMVIKEAAPGAVEKISYGMPGFDLNGSLVWFAAWQSHIGFYPVSPEDEAFKEKLAGYKGSKGTVQFPLDQPIPYDLIREIVQYRAAANLEGSRLSKTPSAKARKAQTG